MGAIVAQRSYLAMKDHEKFIAARAFQPSGINTFYSKSGTDGLAAFSVQTRQSKVVQGACRRLWHGSTVANNLRVPRLRFQSSERIEKEPDANLSLRKTT